MLKKSVEGRGGEEAVPVGEKACNLRVLKPWGSHRKERERSSYKSYRIGHGLGREPGAGARTEGPSSEVEE